ncbi:hypothetical protein J4Q44_G00291610 [Coregonus suidteri]|uniref:Uncharacterized protein n=1 Tax=Coregonus suidteri TaxID=861788 RepID=A0AAN8L0D2_9TELE
MYEDFDEPQPNQFKSTVPDCIHGNQSTSVPEMVPRSLDYFSDFLRLRGESSSHHSETVTTQQKQRNPSHCEEEKTRHRGQEMVSDNLQDLCQTLGLKAKVEEGRKRRRRMKRERQMMQRKLEG